MTIPADTRTPRYSRRPTARYLLIAAAIILIGALLQIRCLSRDFQKVIDDNQLIYNYEDRGCNEKAIDCFKHPVFQIYYRPLFTATFALQDQLLRPANTRDYELGRDTRSYHLENMLLHMAVCALSFWFFFLLFRRELPALLAGLIFTLHPLQVTVTTFIGGRPDSMALFFLLLYCIGALNTARTPLRPRSPGQRIFWFCISLLGYSAAVFTKEQCILLLLLLPLLLRHESRLVTESDPYGDVPVEEASLDRWDFRTFLRQNLGWGLLYLVPVATYVFAARKIIPFNTESSYHAHVWSFPLHLEMIGRTLWYFERLLLAPTLGPIHQSTLGAWDTPQIAVALTGYLLAAIWLGALWRMRNNAAVRFCMLWATLTVFPCLNIVPIPSQFASCYRAVIPLLGIAGVLGTCLERLFTWWSSRSSLDLLTDGSLDFHPASRHSLKLSSPIWGLVLILALYYSWETMADVETWRNNETLMYAELYGDPNFTPSYQGLGFWYEPKGQWKKVEENFDHVLSSFMPAPQPGQSFAALVDSPECQRTLWSHAGLRYHPKPYILWLLPHRGWAKQSQGHFVAAAADYRLVLELNPDDSNSRANLYTCYRENGEVEKALSLYNLPSEVPPRRDPNR